MNRSELTRGILDRYRELSGRRGVERWRRVVPSDVRRLWIRHLFTDIAQEKMSGTPGFEDLILQYASPHERSYIEHLQRLVAELPRTPSGAFIDEGDESPVAAYVSALQSVELPDEALERFAELYFLTFRGSTQTRDRKITDRFSNEVHAAAQHTFTGMNELVSNPGALLALVGLLHDDQTPAGRALLSFERRVGAHPFRQPPFTNVVVYGSAAIGPRTPTYPGTQDIDILLIPNAGANKMAHQFFSQRAEWAEAVVHYVTQLSEQHPTLPQEQRSVREQIIRTSLPVLERLLKVLQHGPHPIDLHLPEHPTNFSDPTGDWPKLCGPHILLHKEVGDKSYSRYLDRSIRSARALSKNIEP